MTESIKDMLKPIRRKAQDAKGVEKMIYDNMLNDIAKLGKDVTRQEIICELERQQRENSKNLKEDEKRTNY